MRFLFARVMKLVDLSDSKSDVARRTGSSPVLGTISMRGERENETRPGLKAGVSERACRWNPCRILHRGSHGKNRVIRVIKMCESIAVPRHKSIITAWRRVTRVSLGTVLNI